MAPRPGSTPLPWACLLTAGDTLRTLAVAWVVLGALAISKLYNSLWCAAWALELARWFPASACLTDAVILVIVRCALPQHRVSRHAIRLLLAIGIIAIVPYRVFWWEYRELCR